MFVALMLLLAAAAGFAAETKTPIEVSGPETVGAPALAKGVEWHVVNRGVRTAVQISVASPVKLQAEPTTLDLPQFGSATVKLRLANGAEAPGKEAPATVFFYTGASKLLVERKLTVTVSTPQPKIALAELAGWQMRGFLSPFASAPEVCTALPLSEPLPAGSAGGGLVASSGHGIATVNVKAGSGTDVQLCFDQPEPGTYTGELAPIWNGKPLGTVKLKYSIADGPVLAIISAISGVLTAWWLKRTLNVTRVTAGLRHRAAAALQAFDNTNAPAFAKAIEGRPKLEGLMLRPSAFESWKSVDAAASALDQGFMVKIDDKALKAVEDQVISLEGLGGEWVQFGKAQAALSDQGDLMTAAVKSSEPTRPATFSGSPAFRVTVNATLEVKAVRPGEVVVRRQTAQALTGAAAEWIRVHNAAEQLDGDWKNDPGANASSTLKQKYAGAIRQWDAMWSKLWMTAKPDEVVAIAPLLTPLAAAISGVNRELNRELEGDVGGERVPVSPDIGAPAVAAEAFKQRVETSERALVIVGVVLAVMAGMSTTYLGQPFGSLKNYIDLFLWGAGTKTGLDLLMPLVEQLASLMPRGAAKA